jgi:hypothetical protein
MRDPNGVVNGLVLHQNGAKTERVRGPHIGHRMMLA